jgi:beta-1,4-mannosyl-glycoprotein beta-1,4-N-acetylglucosaminyltransferase
MARIIDVFLYNGEKDIARLHFEILDPYVDLFIVLEAKTTFTGHKKPLYFSEHEQYFKEFWHKTQYHIIRENYSIAEIEQAAFSPNTQGADHWRTEFLQKESIHKALKRYAGFDDIIYIGDVDEIWEPYQGAMPAKLKLKVYAYYLDNRSDEEFWGTYVDTYAQFKGKCLNHERSRTDIRTPDYHGWHFTSMGGLQEVKRKLDDSYTTESYNTYEVQANLPERHKQGVDYLGRNFHFTTDETEWPIYLQRNKDKFKHLCRV